MYRSGCGSKLFQHMLADQRAHPRWDYHLLKNKLNIIVSCPQSSQKKLLQEWILSTLCLGQIVIFYLCSSIGWKMFPQVFGRRPPKRQTGLVPEEALRPSQHHPPGLSLGICGCRFPNSFQNTFSTQEYYWTEAVNYSTVLSGYSEGLHLVSSI